MTKISKRIFLLGLATSPLASGVSAEIAGDATGLQPTGVVCSNLSTGQRVLSTTSGPEWDCGALGLSFSPGDRVETGLRGSVPLDGGALAFDALASSLPRDFGPNFISDEAGGDFHLGDLDGDGDLDVVAESPFRWYENLGGPTPIFTLHLLDHLLLFGSFVTGSELLDANGDGRLDIVAANLIGATPRQLSLFQNNGGAPPTFSRIDISREFPWDVRGGRSSDVDGDSDIDFYALRHELNCGPCTQELVWLESTGNDQYVKHQIATDKVGSFAPVDVDLDGDPDVVMSSANELSWFENEGATFSQEHLIPRTEWATRMDTADLDGDGDEDLLGSGNGTVYWYENLGDGSFVERLLDTFPGNFLFGMPIADFSSDGRLDVVLADEDEPVWLENLGGTPLSFREHSLIGVFNSSNTLFVGSGVGDIDGDGRLDFVANTTPSFDWYRNQIGRRLVVGGVSVRGFFCRNRTTGQTVRVPTTDTAIDCENEGLTVNAGDEIEVFARGQAE